MTPAFLHFFLTLSLCTLILSAGPATAWSSPAARVTLTPMDIVIEVGNVLNFTSMTVRIVDPHDTLLLKVQSHGEPVVWTLNNESVDGQYRYEAVVLSYDPTVSPQPDRDSGERADRVFGTFTVRHGQIGASLPHATRAPLENLWERLEIATVTLLHTLISSGTTEVSAQDVTVSSTAPSVVFDDTQDEDVCNTGSDWILTTDGGNTDLDTSNIFRISGIDETSVPGVCGLQVPIIELNYAGNLGIDSAEKSLVVESNGNMTLANGAVFINRSTESVKIGSLTAGGEELDITSFSPEIGLVDETGTDSQMNLQYDNGEFAIEGNGQQDIVRVTGSGPADALFIGSTGRVGMGTASPLGRLHVVDNVDANSFIWVQNPNAGTEAASVLRSQSDVAIMNFQSHASTRTLARFGQTLGGWGEFLQVQGNGLAIGAVPNVPLVLGTNNTQRVRITAVGVQVFGTFTNSSSREYKEDIRPLASTEALATLAKLEPVKFRFKEQPEENLGFIAEEVPELVAVEGHKSVAPMDLIALLTKVAKEQQQTITRQQQTIADLSTRVKKLEEKR